MATTRHHLNLRGAVLVTVVAVVALVAPSSAKAYGWPIEPFERQHPVRGFFGDPRVGDAHERGRSFHFGVDISAPDGTPVYATLTGTAFIDAERRQVVAVRSGSDPSVVFAYWHIVPTVRSGQAVTAYRTVLGHIARGWAHVHFAEQRNGRHLNPLRRGAMSPYADRTRPTIHAFRLERRPSALGRHTNGATFDLVAEVSDDTPVPVARPWFDRPVMPALVRWRIREPERVRPWQTAADFRLGIPPNPLFNTVYVRWTRQNKPWCDGRYGVVLLRGWSLGGRLSGIVTVEIAATDTRGNTARRSFTVTVR
jgi:hypothetical protein